MDLGFKQQDVTLYVSLRPPLSFFIVEIKAAALAFVFIDVNKEEEETPKTTRS